nr:uncharacterized protein LOC104094272 isoform X2 [Nicotiana tomentosiformis]
MFSIDVHTSPGPDGYGSNFSEKLVGEEVTNVVLQFIRNGKLPRKINSTLIALIPKVPAHQFAGITREEQEEIIAMAEFIQGTLPMRKIADC